MNKVVSVGLNGNAIQIEENGYNQLTAHKICPYSNATRGNMEVGFTVEGKA